MYPKYAKKKKLIRLIITYTLMTLAVVLLVTFIVFFMLGYRFDKTKGQIEQYSFIQLISSPSGASVSIDGASINSKTPTKISVSAGDHEIVMWRDGYDKWQKTISTKAGDITWVNYVLLTPSQISVEDVSIINSLYSSLSTLDGQKMIIQSAAESPSFHIVDMSSNEIKGNVVSLPAKLYSGQTALINHVFSAQKWDKSGRYVIIKHSFDQNSELILLDTQNVSESKNISKLFDVSIDQIDFADASGSVFYALISKDVRKLNLSDETLSKPLVGGVEKFYVDSNTGILTYVGLSEATEKERIFGLYRDGDDKSHSIRSTKSSTETPLFIKATHYFNEDYIVIADGKNVEVLAGDFASINDSSSGFKSQTSFSVDFLIQDMMFNSSGKYVLVRSGADFVSYDLAYQELSTSKIICDQTVKNIQWLDESHVWSSCGDYLSIRDYDGQNIRKINSALDGQDVLFTKNGKYIYSLYKKDSGYQLQRAKMVLP